MRLYDAFHDEVRRKVGHPASNLIPRGEPRWTARREPHRLPSSVSQMFRDNAELARAMGLGGSREHRRGSRAWRRRKNLLDNAARWRRGARAPERGVWGPRLTAAGRAWQRREATPRNDRQVLELMRRFGFTVVRFDFHHDYDDRYRTVAANVYVSPALFEEYLRAHDITLGGRLRWGTIAQAFAEAWSLAYSGSDATFGDQIDDVDALTFRIGREDDVAYAYHLGGEAA